MRQLLLAPHAGQSRERHVEASGGLLDSVGEQRVWRQLREDPVPVLQRRLDRRGEPHCVTQVVRPVIGIPCRLITWVIQRGGVVRDRRRHRSRDLPRPRPVRRGSDRPEANGRRRRRPLRAPSLRAAPRLRPGREWTAWRRQRQSIAARRPPPGRHRAPRAPPAPRARSSAGSSTDAIAPAPAMRDISRDRRQMTRTPSSSDSAPATTAAAASPRECPMTAPGLHPIRLHRGGQCDLHGE